MDPTANLIDPMDLAESLEALRTSTISKVGNAQDIDGLAAVENEAVGRESPIAAARRGLGKMPNEERRDAGRLINDVAKQIEAIVATRREELQSAAREATIRDEAIDVTVDYAEIASGRLHLIQQVTDEVCDIFVGLGYHVAEGPEAELAWYNFDALNTPLAHPARLGMDTMYVDYGDEEDGMVLRSHTSPIQARYMENHEPPVYLVAPGKAYRNDTIDASHLPVFHQIEGLAVDESICDGSGSSCRVCKGVGWLEMLGCGMVDPNVFEAVGYDPEAVTGFAFGMGVERLAMVRHGIDSIRHFVDNDVRFLNQFPG